MVRVTWSDAAVPEEIAIRNFRQSEVEHLRVPARGYKNVCRLDVAMHDALGVRRIERIGDFDRQRQQRLVVERTPGDAVLEGRALKKLHRDEGLSLVPPDFVDGADIGMVQRRSRPCLAAKAFQRLRVACQIVRKEFQGNKAAEFGVLSFVDDAHPAAAQLFEDVITGDRLPDHRVGTMLGAKGWGVNELRGYYALRGKCYTP